MDQILFPVTFKLDKRDASCCLDGFHCSKLRTNGFFANKGLFIENPKVFSPKLLKSLINTVFSTSISISNKAGVKDL